MQFYRFTPCSGNSSYCAEGILAVGVIESDTAAKLLAFKPREGQKIYLHSPGGALVGGLALGQAIRDLRLSTIVGGSYSEQYFGEDENVFIKDSICASSCTLAFLGGINRLINDEKSYLVHQFFTKLGINYESSTQETVALLHGYLDRMGMDRSFLDGMLTTRPEKLAYYTLQDLWTFGVITEAPIGNSPIKESIEHFQNRWQLEYDSMDRPRVAARRKTDKSNGEVELSLRVGHGGDFIINLSVIWDDHQDPSRVKSAFEALTEDYRWNAEKRLSERIGYADTEIAFCKEKDNFAIPCDISVWDSTITGQDWITSQNGYKWELQAVLPKRDLGSLILQRPPILEFDCKMPNVLLDFSFCDGFVLNETFWRHVNLIDAFSSSKTLAVVPNTINDSSAVHSSWWSSIREFLGF